MSFQENFANRSRDKAEMAYCFSSKYPLLFSITTKLVAFVVHAWGSAMYDFWKIPRIEDEKQPKMHTPPEAECLFLFTNCK